MLRVLLTVDFDHAPESTRMCDEEVHSFIGELAVAAQRGEMHLPRTWPQGRHGVGSNALG